MFGLICLYWIGLQLNAPTWYFWVLGISAFLTILNFGFKMYKIGGKNK